MVTSAANAHHRIRPAPMQSIARSALPAALFLALASAATPAAADETKKFQDWTMVCENTGPVEKRSCIVSTIITDSATKLQLLGVAVGAGEAGKGLRMAIKTAPQVRKDDGVHFRVDKGQVYSAPFGGCTKDACILQFALPDQLVTQMKKGAAMLVTFTGEDGKALGVQVPLKGFSAGINAVAARRPK